MANRIVTEIRAEDVDHSAKLKQAEADLKSFGKANKDAADAADKAAARSSGAFGKVSGAAGGVGKALTNLQAGLSKLLIPAAMVGAVAGLAAKFREAGREVRQMRREIEAANERVAAIRVAPFIAERQDEAQIDMQQQSAAIDAEIAALQAKAAELSEANQNFLDTAGDFTRNLLSKGSAQLFGTDIIPTITERIEELGKAQEALGKQRAQLIRDLDAHQDKKRIEQTDAELIAARRKLATDEERAQMDTNRRVGELTKRFKEADTDEERAKIIELGNLELQIAMNNQDEIRARKLRDREEDERAERESKQRAHEREIAQIRAAHQERVNLAREFQSLQQSQVFGDSNTSVLGGRSISSAILGGRTVNVKQGGEFTRSIR